MTTSSKTTFVLALLMCLFAHQADAQKSKAKSGKPEKGVQSQKTIVDTAMTPGKRQVEAAYGYQRKLQKSLVSMTDVLKNWQRITREKQVRADPDALAIAYGCEGLLDLQLGRNLEADSVLRIAMPLFKFVSSKGYFIVALAELDRKLSFYDNAIKCYHEILSTMDSLPQLEQIDFYRESGYAPFAYGIDAALGMALISASKEEYHADAVKTLGAVADKHSRDALGLMALTALTHLDTANITNYNFRIERIYSARPKLRQPGSTFEMQFEGLKPKTNGDVSK